MWGVCALHSVLVAPGLLPGLVGGFSGLVRWVSLDLPRGIWQSPYLYTAVFSSFAFEGFLD